MKTSVKWIIGLTAAFFMCIITAGILFFSAVGFGNIKSDILNNKGTILNKSVVQEIDENKESDLEGVNLIQLNTSFGNVKVIENKDDELVKLSVKGKIYNLSFPKREFKFDLIKEGGALKFKITDDWTYFGIGNFFKGDIILQIPDTYDKDLNINVGSGSANLFLENQFNNLKLDVSSGNINISSINCEKSDIILSSGVIQIGNLKVGEADININSGRIEIEKLVAKEAYLNASSGNLIINDCKIETNLKININSGSVKLKGDFKTLDAKISSGDIDIESKKLAGDYKIEVNSGTFKLKLPAEASYAISGKVGSGIVKANGKKYAKNFDADIKGGGYKINIKVSSGYAEIS